MLQNTASTEDKHKSFIERVVASGKVWGLKSQDGWAMSYSNDEDEIVVMPFWSDKAYAAAVAKDEWAEYAPEEIDLPEFLDQWVFGMSDDEVLVGTNWDQNMAGKELEPYDLALEIVAKIKVDNKDLTFPEGFTLDEYETVLRQTIGGSEA